MISDASVEGVRCEVPNGLIPELEETVYFEWPDASACFAQVVWKRRTHIALRFHCLEPNFIDKLDTASLGAGSYVRMVALQQAWIAART